MKILGFGQVLWDLTVEADFSFLEELNFSVGGHYLVEKETLDSIIKKLKTQNHKIIKNSGGSVANVMSNMAKLGSTSAFCGKHGDDEDGYNYMKILVSEGVETHGIIDENNSTGQLLSVITPDKDRTFIVYWGAAGVLPAKMVSKELIKSVDICHIEGYLMVNSEAVLRKIFEEAKKITYDLAAYSVVDKTRPILQKMMKKHQPYILFSNIFEGKAFTLKDTPEDIIDEMLQYTNVAVLTLGDEGVIVKTNDGQYHFEKAIKTEVVDTTGAGDSFSAGFLHEFLQSGDIVKAARLGVKTASITIRNLGARSFQIEQLNAMK
ncbi:MAG: adenosine kinase [Asgard group archaeon]|nr:adenosine kinase [Asgard group archaeon]